MEDEIIETGESVETPEASPAPVEQEAPSRFFDPAPFYDQLPSQYKDSKVLEPVFDKYENAYKEALGKYQPYEPFTQHQPEVLAAAVQLFNMIDTPEGARQIYDQIAKVLNITPAEAAEVVAEAVEQEDPEEVDPVQQELNELRAWREEQDNRYQQQVLKEQTAISETVLDKSINDLYAVDPSLKGDTQRLGDLMERVYTMNERTGGKQPLPNLVKQAFESQKAYNQHLYDTLVSGQRTGSRTAPVVMSPSGSNPGSGVNPAERDENARKEAMAEMLRRSRIPS